MSARNAVARDVSRETLERLDRYVALLTLWNTRINLIAPNSVPDIWDRHIRDSLQISRLDDGAEPWADLGSGGGLPGLVVACDQPARVVILVESDRRKALFLETVIRDLSLSAKVFSDRIEAIPPLDAQTISARALAPLDLLLGYAAIHLREGGTCLFPKGRNHMDEIEKARQRWTFAMETIQSQTSSESAILRIRDLKPS